MPLRALYWVAISLTLVTASTAQTKVDSLTALLADQPNDVVVLIELTEELGTTNPTKAVTYGRRAIDLKLSDGKLVQAYYWTAKAYESLSQLDSIKALSSRLDNASKEEGPTLEIATAYLMKGIYNHKSGAVEEAKLNLNLSLERFEQLSNTWGAALSMQVIGSIYFERSDYDSAIIFLSRAQEKWASLNDQRRLLLPLSLIGTSYYYKSDFENALSNYSKSLEITSELDDKVGMASALNNIGNIHSYQGDYLKTITFYSRSLAIRQQIGDSSGIGASLNNIGIIYSFQGDKEKALSYFNQALEVRTNLKDQQGVVSTLSNIGIVQQQLGEYDNALSTFTEALSIQDSIGTSIRMIPLYNGFAEVYNDLGDFDNALSHYSKALEIAEELNTKSNIAYTLDAIGKLYQNHGEYNEALQFHVKALSMQESLGLQNDIATSLDHIGSISKIQVQYEDALKYYTRSLNIREKLGDKKGIANAMHNIGTVHYLQKSEEEALKFLTKSLQISQDNAYAVGMAETSLEVSKVYWIKGESDSALHFVNQAISIADTLGGLPLLSRIHEHRSLVLEQTGAFEEALDSYKNFKYVHDSIFNSESQSVIAEIQAQFKSKEQQQKIQLLEQDQRIQRQLVISLIVGLILLGTIIFLVYNRFRLKNRAHVALQNAQSQLVHSEKMAALGQLTAGIAHEINNPVNFVKNGIEALKYEVEDALKSSDTEATTEVGELIQSIQNGARRTSEIVASLRTFSRVDEDSVKAFDIQENMKSTLLLLRSKMNGEIEIEEKYCELNEIEAYAGKLNQVFMNVLDNAVQAILGAKKSGRISIRTESENGRVKISIKDNGAGIDEKFQDKIFDPFFTTKEVGKGTGLGLSISHAIVEQHKGDIKVKSVAGEGTEFLIDLPISQS